MVANRRRRISKNARRRSRRPNNLARRIALVANRCPFQSRIPRDPPAIPDGFDYLVRVPFLVRMIWNSDSSRTTSFSVTLPASPTGIGTITLYARHNDPALGSTSSNRQYFLDYDEMWAAAFVRATSADITTASSRVKASTEFSLVSAKIWGPLAGGGGLLVRIDGGPSLSGGCASDTGGRNHRAAVGFTFPTRDWQKFDAIDKTTPALLVGLSRVGLSALAPEAAGTAFPFENQIDMGQVHITARIRYGLAVNNSTPSAGLLSTKATTMFEQD